MRFWPEYGRNWLIRRHCSQLCFRTKLRVRNFFTMKKRGRTATMWTQSTANNFVSACGIAQPVFCERCHQHISAKTARGVEAPGGRVKRSACSGILYYEPRKPGRHRVRPGKDVSSKQSVSLPEGVSAPMGAGCTSCEIR